MQKNLPTILSIGILSIGIIVLFNLTINGMQPTSQKPELIENPPSSGTPPTVITNFMECVSAGNPVMESYPRQCRAGDNTFPEYIGNELEVVDLIRLEYPRPNQTISSPLTVKGQARGNWFFEASFPVYLTDWDGKIIAQGIAQAKSDWMTTEFVPFEAELTYTVEKDIYSKRGSLILKKDNPSGLPEHDNALEIPVLME